MDFLKLNVLLNTPNLSDVGNQIKRALSITSVDINPRISPSSAAALNGLNSGLKNISTLTKLANEHLANTSKRLSQSTYDMAAFGQQSALALKRFVAFSAASSVFLGIAYSIKRGISEANSFEKEMLKVAQTTGKSYTNLSDLTSEITRLSSGLGVSSKELANASLLIAQAGYSAKETKTALEALALTDISPSFDNMVNTSEAMIAIGSQFGIAMDEMKTKLSSLNAVAAAYAVESSDITQAIKTTGGAFKNAGGSLEELMALFTSVRATTRESADSIATSFRTIFTRMQRPSTIQFLKEIGIELSDSKQQFIGAFGAVEQLSQALSNLPTTDPRYSQIIEELGGYRQISKVIPLIQQYSTALQALDVAQAGTNSLQEQAGVALTGLSSHLSRVKEDFLGLMRELTQDAGFKVVINQLLDLAQSLIKVTSAIQPLIPMIAVFGGIKAAMSVATGLGGFEKGLRLPLGGVPKIPGKASGGYIPGHGDGDNTLIYATPGEFVVRKAAAQKLGANFLNNINHYAGGGAVVSGGATYNEKFGNYRAAAGGIVINLNGIERAFKGGQILPKEFSTFLHGHKVLYEKVIKSIDSNTRATSGLSSLAQRSRDIILGTGINNLAQQSRMAHGLTGLNQPYIQGPSLPPNISDPRNYTQARRGLGMIPSSMSTTAVGRYGEYMPGADIYPGLPENRSRSSKYAGNYAVIADSVRKLKPDVNNNAILNVARQIQFTNKTTFVEALKEAKVKLADTSNAGLVPLGRYGTYTNVGEKLPSYQSPVERQPSLLSRAIRRGYGTHNADTLESSNRFTGKLSGMAMMAYLGSPLVSMGLEGLGVSKEGSDLASRGITSTAMSIGIQGSLANGMIEGRTQRLINQRDVLAQQLETHKSDIAIAAKEGRLKDYQNLRQQQQVAQLAHNQNQTGFDRTSRISSGLNAGILIGSVGMGVLSTASQYYQGYAQKDAGAGDETSFRRAIASNQRAQKLQAAGYGSMAGSLIGGAAGSFTPVGPIGGALIGNAVGGGLGYIGGGGDNKDIQKIRLNKLVDDVTSNINNLAKGLNSGQMRVSLAISEISSQIDAANKTLGLSIGKMRPEVLSQLAQQAPNLRSIITNMIAEISSLDEFMSNFGSSGNKILELYSSLTNKSLPSVIEQVDKEIAARQKSVKAARDFSNSIKELGNVGLSIDRIASSFAQASENVSEQITRIGTRDNTGLSNYRGIPGAVSMLKNPENANIVQLENVIKQSMGNFGESGKELASVAINGAKAIQELPGMLSLAASKSGLSDETLLTNLDAGGQLKDKFGPVIRQYIVAGINELSTKNAKGNGPGEVIKEISENPREFVNQLFKNSSLPAINETLAKIVGETVEILNNINSQYQRYVNVLSQIQQKEIDIRQGVMDKEIFLASVLETPRRGIRAQLNFANNTQQVLAGNLANNPQGIANRIIDLKSQKMGLDTQLQSGENTKNIQNQRVAVESELENLTKALNDLSSSTTRLKAQQEGLAIETNKRKSIQEYSSAYAFGSPDTRRGMGRTFASASYAAKTNNLDRVPMDMREATLGFLERFSDVELPMFGKDKKGNVRKGRDVIKDVTATNIMRSGVSSGASKADIDKAVQSLYQSKEEKQWLEELNKTFNLTIGAQEAMRGILIDSKDTLHTDLDKIHTLLQSDILDAIKTAKTNDLQQQLQNFTNDKNKLERTGTGIKSAKEQLGITGSASDVTLQTQQISRALPLVGNLQDTNKTLRSLNGASAQADFLRKQQKEQYDGRFIVNPPQMFRNLPSDTSTLTYEQINKHVEEISKPLMSPLQTPEAKNEIKEAVRIALGNMSKDKSPTQNYDEIVKALKDKQSKYQEKSGRIQSDITGMTKAIDKDVMNNIISKPREEIDILSKNIGILAEEFKNTNDLWKDNDLDEKLKGLEEAIQDTTDRLNTLKLPNKNGIKKNADDIPAEFSAVSRPKTLPKNMNRILANVTASKKTVNNNLPIEFRNDEYGSDWKSLMDYQQPESALDDYYKTEDKPRGKDLFGSTKPYTFDTYFRDLDLIERNKKKRATSASRQSTISQRKGYIPNNINAENTTDAGRNIIGPQPKIDFKTNNNVNNAGAGNTGNVGNTNPKFIEAMGGFGPKIDLFVKSIDSFSSAVDRLQGVKIEFTGKHDVNINLNGAEALNNLMPEIKKLVETGIINSFQKYNEQMSSSGRPSSINLNTIKPFDSQGNK